MKRIYSNLDVLTESQYTNPGRTIAGSINPEVLVPYPANEGRLDGAKAPTRWPTGATNHHPEYGHATAPWWRDRPESSHPTVQVLRGDAGGLPCLADVYTQAGCRCAHDRRTPQSPAPVKRCSTMCVLFITASGTQ